jgi:hypothetical protein
MIHGRPLFARLKAALATSHPLWCELGGGLGGGSRVGKSQHHYFADGNDHSDHAELRPGQAPELVLQPALLADGHSRRFVARPTEGADHDRLFALAEGYYSGYSRYAANTDGARLIPVLGLMPT